MFKMMEQGQLLAHEIFPDVAKEMQRVANVAGALEEKMKTTRVAQGRFFKELETAQNKIFTGGFDKGGGTFFNTLAEVLRENDAALEALGKAFKAVLKAIAAGVRFLAPILGMVTNIVGRLIGQFDKIFGSGHGTYVAGIVAITYAVKRLGDMMSRKLAIVLAVVAALEEMVALTTKGMVGNIELALGKDIAISNVLGATTSGQGESVVKDLFLSPGKLMGLLRQSAGKDGAGKTTIIQQSNTIEVPAGATEGYFKGIVEDSIDRANQKLINGAYQGGS
jgi:hypothetical protein